MTCWSFGMTLPYFPLIFVTDPDPTHDLNLTYLALAIDDLHRISQGFGRQPFAVTKVTLTPALGLTKLAERVLPASVIKLKTLVI